MLHIWTNFVASMILFRGFIQTKYYLALSHGLTHIDNLQYFFFTVGQKMVMVFGMGSPGLGLKMNQALPRMSPNLVAPCSCHHHSYVGLSNIVGFQFNRQALEFQILVIQLVLVGDTQLQYEALSCKCLCFSIQK